MLTGMARRASIHHCVVVDAVTGHPLAGVASPELEAAAAAEDGLQFASESLGVWTLVDAEPAVLAAHRRLKREVRLVAVARRSEASAA